MQIELSRKARVTNEGLDHIRQSLRGNDTAQRFIGQMLRYANELLTNSERNCRHYRDMPQAVVEYGGKSFTFIRQAS